MIHKSFLLFSIIVQKNLMVQVESYYTSRIVNQFKTTRAKQCFFLNDRHLEHMVSYQGMQSGLPVFVVVGEFNAFEFFMKNAVL